MKRAGVRGILAVVALAVCGGYADAEVFFRHGKTFKIGPHVTAIVAADFDEDGLVEIVTADRGRLFDPREQRPANDQLSYLVPDGPLQYVRKSQLSTGFGPYAIAVENIDALRAPDLVVANFMATRNRDLTLLRFVGNGIFEPTQFSVPDEGLSYARMRDGDDVPLFTTPGLTSVAVRDFDRDGYRDVLATGWTSDTLVYFPGDRTAYFKPPVVRRLSGGPRDITLGDLNGDGHTDAAVALYSANEIALLAGDGKGGFEEATRFPSRGKLPQRIRVADLNADGRQELIVSHRHADDSVVIFWGAEKGFAFPHSQEIALGETRGKIEYGVEDLVIADFNGDNRPDIALAASAAREVIVLVSETVASEVRFRYQRERYRFDNGKPRALCTADFDGNGKTDLAVGLWEADAVALLLSR